MFSMIIGLYFLASPPVVQAPPPTCLPPFWGGVLAGSSIKEDVLRLYGPGIFVSEEGDTGGSYYRDAQGSVTLHVVYYTDNIVGELEVIEGNALPARIGKGPEAASPYLKPPFLHVGLAFGSTEKAVLASMGQPTRREKNGSLVTLVYLSACRCELDSGISFVFKDGKFFKVLYWSDTG